MRLILCPLFAAVIGGILLASPAAAAPDQAQGVAFMLARISSSGALSSGIGVSASKKIGTGLYEVTFNRTIATADCVFLANANILNATVQPTTTNQNTITVNLVTLSGTRIDRSFEVLGFCAR